MILRQPFKGSYPITLDYGATWENIYTKANPHKGIDYGCPEGTTILASAEGYILCTAFASTGYGHYILISHEDGTGTVYAHLKAILVKEGQKVNRGQAIAFSGNSGNSTGPHLHFEYRSKASDYRTAVDPKQFMQSVLDEEPINNNTPAPIKPKFEPIRAGYCMVVCDVANVRCHCDMDRIIGQKKKGDIIAVGDETTMYNGLPYRDYYDPTFNCWLRIAEHDPYDQIIENYDITFQQDKILNTYVDIYGTRDTSGNTTP